MLFCFCPLARVSTRGFSERTVMSCSLLLSLGFFGWIDEVYPPQPTSNSISLTISNGGSLVLECHANTTATIEHILWLREGKLLHFSSTDNHYQLPDRSSLLVRNVLLSDMRTVSYTCIVELQFFNQSSRTFTISTSKGRVWILAYLTLAMLLFWL